jgi:hypothetical protein
VANPAKVTPTTAAAAAYLASKSGACHDDLGIVVSRAADALLAADPDTCFADGGNGLAALVDSYARNEDCRAAWHDRDVADALVARAVDALDRLEAPPLATLAVGVMKLGYSDEALIDALARRLIPHMGSLPPKAVVTLACALPYAHTELLEALVARGVMPRVHTYKLEGLNDLVMALNRLGHYDRRLMETLKAGP